ncbi:MAG: 50S ribosomal protein L24 [Candidatus Portnoybacteria bacterium]|nr:50S ribosomal protein L24 [Candidatus Portnoybacteria bacterium]
MKIKNGDTVLIISGKDKGKTGKVIQAFPDENRIIVEGLNIVKKHVRPKRSGEKGQVVEVPRSIDASNVKLMCPKCKKASRVGYKLIDEGREKKVRICKKCKQEV